MRRIFSTCYVESDSNLQHRPEMSWNSLKTDQADDCKGRWTFFADFQIVQMIWMIIYLLFEAKEGKCIDRNVFHVDNLEGSKEIVLILKSLQLEVYILRDRFERVFGVGLGGEGEERSSSAIRWRR